MKKMKNINLVKKFFLFASFLLSLNCAYAVSDKEALLEIIRSDTLDVQKSLVNNLQKYNQWWASLSQNQRKIAYKVDAIESRYKLANGGIPVPANYANISYVCQLLNIRNARDTSVVEERMKQHLADYDDTQNLERLNQSYEKAIKKIQED